MLRALCAVLTIALLIGCKPPPALISEEAAIAARVAELQDVVAHAEERRAQQAKVLAELKTFDVDPAVVAALMPDGGTIASTSAGTFDATLPPGPIGPAVALITKLLDAAPELRATTLVRSEHEIRFVARIFESSVYVEPEPTLTVGRPAFCSRACKELAARAVKEELELQRLVAKAKTLTQLAAQERRLVELRADQDGYAPNSESMSQLARLAQAPWFADRSEGWVEFETSDVLGVKVSRLRVHDLEKVTKATCDAHFAGVAMCNLTPDGELEIEAIPP
ncbi:MAG: hypothetical protein QM817_06400 [Archangium sp.]